MISPCPLIAIATLILVAACKPKDESPESKPESAVTQEPPAAPAPAVAALPPISMEDFFTAALEGDLAKVKQGITQPGATTFADEDGRTGFMLAAFNGHTEIVDLFLQAGAKVDTLDNIKRSALMYASTGPNAATVSLLIKRGANVNLTDGEQNWTPLMFATAEGQTEVVRLLLAAGANPNSIDSDGDTCLKFATSKGFKEIEQMITQAIAKSTAPTANPPK